MNGCVNYIFDLYGTLVDIDTDESQEILWEKMALAYSLMNADYTPYELREAYLRLVDEETKLRKKNLPEIPFSLVEPDLGNVFRRLFTEKNPSLVGSIIPEGEIEKIAVFFRALSMKHLQLFPDAKETISKLRSAGKRVFLLSNAQRLFTQPELLHLNLFGSFDGILLSSDAGIKKPSPALFMLLFRRYHLVPEECVMIGNDHVCDIAGADSVGLSSVYIHSWESPPRPDSLPASCRELQSLADLI